jgi:hypothetical protein
MSSNIHRTTPATLVNPRTGTKRSFQRHDEVPGDDQLFERPIKRKRPGTPRPVNSGLARVPNNQKTLDRRPLTDGLFTYRYRIRNTPENVREAQREQEEEEEQAEQGEEEQELAVALPAAEENLTLSVGDLSIVLAPSHRKGAKRAKEIIESLMSIQTTTVVNPAANSRLLLPESNDKDYIKAVIAALNKHQASESSNMEMWAAMIDQMVAIDREVGKFYIITFSEPPESRLLQDARRSKNKQRGPGRRGRD